MNGNMLVVMLMVVLAGAGTTAYVASERRAHENEVVFLSDHVKTYANYVSTAARNNPALTGTLTRQQANVPAWISLEPTVSNYVTGGVAYIFFTPKNLAEGNEIARKCGATIVCGVKNTANRIVQPGSGDAALAAPSIAPVGSFVMRLDAGDPNCVVPDRESTQEVDPQTMTQNCPAGQVGSLTLSRTRERSAFASCPQANGPLQWSFSGWSDPDWTVSAGSCTACPAPVTNTSTQWVSAEQGCPAGQYGRRWWEKEQRQSETVSYSCPAGTQTLPAPTSSGFGAWTDTGATRDEMGACVTCPPATTENLSQWVPVTGACPIGQTGQVSWEKELVATRNVSYSCPAGSDMPESTFGPTSSWTESGAVRGNSSTCEPCSGPPAMEYEYRWVDSSQTCSAGQFGQRTWQRQQVRSRSLGYNTCPAAMGAQARTAAGAKAMASAQPAEGKPTGGNGQQRPVENWSEWTDTGSTRNQAGSCTACRVPETTYEFQWVPASQSCPAGQTGSWTWDKQQSRTRTVTQSCPAGTIAAPPLHDTGWTGWTDTGARQAESNTCTAAPQYCGAGQTFRGVGWVDRWSSNDFNGSWSESVWGPTMSPQARANAVFAFENIAYTSWSNFDPTTGGQVNQNQSYSWSAGYGNQNACQSTADINNVHLMQDFNFECVSGQGMHACDYNSTTTNERVNVCEAICSPTGQPWIDPTSYTAGQDVACDGVSTGTQLHPLTQQEAINKLCQGAPVGVSGVVNWCPRNQIMYGVHVTCH